MNGNPSVTTKLPAIQVLGVKVNPLATSTLRHAIEELIISKAHALVLHVNIHGINLAFSENWLRDYLNSAPVVFCDGAGVMLGAHLLGHHIPQRITYADWMWQLAEFCQEKEFTLYFLGAKPGIAEQAGAHLLQKFPNLKIVGIQHGYFDKTQSSSENEGIIKKINLVRPNILLVGFGMPIQERWLMENWSHIEADVALTGGAVFDYISGELQRAPDWMTDHGFEWLGRLIIEPRRLWKRYIIGNPLFLWRVFKQRLGLLKY
ncbi:MAG: WecB/TagA/CpsF family glycosyltransferase [Anaerolineales bacterium]|nr:WecB/TagA/CpsF family glycosyltransferase [Anaerolineales bacterium]